MNLPNKLTVARVILIPVFMVFLAIPPLFHALGDTLTRVISAVLFILISLTDMLDGKIARKRGLVTDFGKFLDPLADKMLVFSACLGILVFEETVRPVFVWAAAIVMFRELAVTGLRMMVAGKSNLVVAASWLGKIKTTTQIVCVSTTLLEPVVFGSWCDFFAVYRPWTYLSIAVMTVMTVWSGANYFATYWKVLDSSK